MRSSLTVFACLVLSAAAQAEGPHPSTDLHIPRLDQLPAHEFERAYTPGNTTPLSDQRRAPATGEQAGASPSTPRGDVLVGTLSIAPWLLVAPSTNNNERAGNFGALHTVSHLELTLEGVPYVLYVADVRRAAESPVRYVTAAVVNSPDGYARFAIDDRRQLLAGTVKVDRGTYRIVPLGAQSQAVYRLRSGTRERPEQFEQVLDSRSSREARALERDAARAEVLALIQPSNFRPDGEHGVYVSRGALGRFNTVRPEINEIRSLLDRLGWLTRYSDATELEITARSPSDSEESVRFVQFRQRVHEMPLNAISEIAFAADGTILEIIANIVDESLIASRPILTRSEAVAVALRAAHSASPSIQLGPHAGQRLECRYSQVSGGLFAPACVVGLGTTQQAIVDMVSGEVAFVSTLTHVTGEEFFHNVHKRTSGSPTAPAAGQTDQIWWEENDAGFDCTASVPADCSNPKYLTPKNVLGTLNFDWETATNANDATVCCVGIGGYDNKLEVIVDTPALPLTSPAAYEYQTRNILFNSHPPGANYSLSPDIIVHEATHAFQQAANPALYDVSTGTQDTADRRWTRAYVEGTADAMVGLEAEKRASLYNFGSPWIMGDGASPLNLDLQRHMDRDYKLSWYEQYEADSAHTAGLVFANFYWRLRQTNVASLDRLMALLMKAFKLTCKGANGVYDLDDFLKAVKDATAPSETALRNAIDTVWQQMDDRDPPPGGAAPLAPSFVDGLPYGCSYYGHSVYYVFWSASATALGYDVGDSWRRILRVLGYDGTR